MATIFNPEENRLIIERLRKITAESKPLWGKMSAAQMMLHCQKPLDVAEGRLILKRNIIGFLFGKMAKNDFLKKNSFKENLPTAAQFRIGNTPDFETERQKLVALIEKFVKNGASVIANKNHPFFGQMTDTEWGTLLCIHLDHHLKQFDV